MGLAGHAAAALRPWASRTAERRPGMGPQAAFRRQPWPQDHVAVALAAAAQGSPQPVGEPNLTFDRRPGVCETTFDKFVEVWGFELGEKWPERGAFKRLRPGHPPPALSFASHQLSERQVWALGRLASPVVGSLDLAERRDALRGSR